MSKQDDKPAEEQLTDDVAPHAENKAEGCDCENCDCQNCQKVTEQLDEMAAN